MPRQFTPDTELFPAARDPRIRRGYGHPIRADLLQASPWDSVIAWFLTFGVFASLTVVGLVLMYAVHPAASAIVLPPMYVLARLGRSGLYQVLWDWIAFTGTEGRRAWRHWARERGLRSMHPRRVRRTGLYLFGNRSEDRRCEFLYAGNLGGYRLGVGVVAERPKYRGEDTPAATFDTFVYARLPAEVARRFEALIVPVGTELAIPSDRRVGMRHVSFESWALEESRDIMVAEAQDDLAVWELFKPSLLTALIDSPYIGFEQRGEHLVVWTSGVGSGVDFPDWTVDPHIDVDTVDGMCEFAVMLVDRYLEQWQ